ncbi:group 1 truncated hemoglobin [Dactylosporangium sp. NBC_01737]|uniref:group I truncated hemoglobin n=1 Tax=Dactylosporangium sp. NBC_01737 TaxID=2975959 RepID=UPI002E151D8F|nr:group 1 truncated hemoglobin [Dactylosporangium sp. NBC_01737]
MTTAVSMYSRVGGGPAVKHVVDQLYTWILSDEELSPYFATVTVESLKRHMAALLAQVLGGPAEYGGRELGEAHRGLGITDAHYTRVVDLALAALFLAHAPRDIVAAVEDTLSAVKADIVVPA